MAPKVFISYAHSNIAPGDMRGPVKALADKLRSNGVEALVDQYLPFPPPSWPSWMFNEIQSADFVLVVGSDEYKRRVESPPGNAGSGANWEGAIVTNELYSLPSLAGKRFIPAVIGGNRFSQTPYFLAATTIYDVTQDAEFSALVLHLRGIPAVVPPPVVEPAWVLAASSEAAQASAAGEEEGLDTSPGLDELLARATSEGWSVRELPGHSRLMSPDGEVILVPRRNVDESPAFHALRQRFSP